MYWPSFQTLFQANALPLANKLVISDPISDTNNAS